MNKRYNKESKKAAIAFLQSKCGLNKTEPNSIDTADIPDDDDMLDDEFCAFSEEDEVMDNDNDDYEDEEELTEKLTKTKVVRDGKRVIKWKTDRDGYKVVKDGTKMKEVKMDSGEKLSRKRGQKAGARKRKTTSKAAQTKRARSTKKRSGLGVK